MPEDNDKKMRALMKEAFPDLLYINDLMEKNDIPAQEVMRALYLLSNIKKISQWGKVIITVKEGEIVAVSQEQQFISVRELNRNK